MPRIALVLLLPLLMGAHLHHESYYQNEFCTGKTEYVLPDRTRIDCLTDNYAIEVDFAEKWYQAIGQSMYYAKYYNDTLGVWHFFSWVKPAVALIIEKPSECKYYYRLKYTYNAMIYQIGPYTCTSADTSQFTN